jgi:hypothetical protein
MYTNVGLVLALPNPFTLRRELFVLEATKNMEQFHDPFSNSMGSGLRLFRLLERVHAIRGGCVWLCPLKVPFDERLENNILAKAKELHGGVSEAWISACAALPLEVRLALILFLS